MAQYKIDRPDLGVIHASRALEVGEANLFDVDTLVYAQVDSGDLDGALATVTEYAALLDMQHADWGTRNVVGWNLFLENRLDEASEVMEAWVVWAEAEMAEDRPTEGYIWDTVAHIRAARGETDGASEAFRLAFALYGDDDLIRGHYGSALTELGFDIGEGDEALLLALDACAATGPACRLIPDVDEYAYPTD